MTMAKMAASTMRGITIPNAIATALELGIDTAPARAVEAGSPPAVVLVVPVLGLDVGSECPA